MSLLPCTLLIKRDAHSDESLHLLITSGEKRIIYHSHIRTAISGLTFSWDNIHLINVTAIKTFCQVSYLFVEQVGCYRPQGFSNNFLTKYCCNAAENDVQI